MITCCKVCASSRFVPASVECRCRAAVTEGEPRAERIASLETVRLALNDDPEFALVGQAGTGRLKLTMVDVRSPLHAIDVCVEAVEIPTISEPFDVKLAGPAVVWAGSEVTM